MWPKKKKKKNQIITSIGEDVEKLDPLALLMGVKNATAILENSWAVPQ